MAKFVKIRRKTLDLLTFVLFKTSEAWREVMASPGIEIEKPLSVYVNQIIKVTFTNLPSKFICNLESVFDVIDCCTHI